MKPVALMAFIAAPLRRISAQPRASFDDRALWCAILTLSVCAFISAILSAANVRAGTVHTITVAEGDTQSLIAAVVEANRAAPDEMTIIRASGLFEFEEEDFFPPVTGHILLTGQPGITTTFDAGSTSSDTSMHLNGPDNLFTVNSGGILQLRQLDFANFRLAGHYTHEQLALFENAGRLELKSIQFRHMIGTVQFPGVTQWHANALIDNFGDLTLDGVAFVDVGLHISSIGKGSILTNESRARLNNVLVLFELDYLQSVISNSGEMTVLNSTFVGRADRFSFPIETLFDGQTEVGNSVIKGHNGAWCSDATSLGHNVHTHPGCDFRAYGDIVNVKLPSLEQETIAVKWHGDEPHHLALTPQPSSILIDSADSVLCSDTDLLGQSRLIDGDGDGVANCDRGAVEFSGTVLKTGGITGYYFDRESDGHYIYVLDNPHNILITWNTFDRSGRQAWIYATGELDDDNFLEADAYINLNGRLTDFGPVDIERAKLWGKIRVQFSSCEKGHFWFESPDPDFGSGEFDFDRLAYSEQLRCIDP